MSDFIADLEAELRAAASRRRRPRPAHVFRFVLPAAGVAVAALAAALVITAGGPSDDGGAKPAPSTVRPQLAVGAGYCVKPGAPRTAATPPQLRDLLAVLRRPQREPDGLPTLNTRGGARPGDISWVPLDAYSPRGTRLARKPEVYLLPGTGDGSGMCRRARQLEGNGPRVCVARGVAGGPFGLACFTPAQIRAGTAMAYFSSPSPRDARVVGVVRDGVKAVRLQGGGAPVVVNVAGNVFDALVPRTNMGAELRASRAPEADRLAILNGTTKAGLASRARDELLAKGLASDVTTGNYIDQMVRRSSVRYAPGHKDEARTVAAMLHVTDVVPLDDETRDLAEADVVVVLGRMR